MRISIGVGQKNNGDHADFRGEEESGQQNVLHAVKSVQVC
jgi:hypothetical protein